MNLGIEPHLAAKPYRLKALANQLSVFPGYKVSQRIRMFIETIFGWMKTVAGARQVKTRGHIRVQGVAYMMLAAMNFTRFAGLSA